MTTPDDLLARRLARDGGQPLFTYYDLATGERVELSVATTANWVAKATGYFVEDLAVETDDVIVVRLPLHWQTAVIMLAGWAAGARLRFSLTPDAAVTVSASVNGDRAAGEAVVLSLAPMGADFSGLVAAQPDSYRPVAPGGADVVADAPDLAQGARVLTTSGYDVAGAIGNALVGPLAAGGSVVMVCRADPDRVAEVAATERATHTFGVDVSGLPRLDGS